MLPVDQIIKKIEGLDAVINQRPPLLPNKYWPNLLPLVYGTDWFSIENLVKIYLLTLYYLGGA